MESEGNGKIRRKMLEREYGGKKNQGEGIGLEKVIKEKIRRKKNNEG